MAPGAQFDRGGRGDSGEEELRWNGGELREIEQGEWVGVKNKGRLRVDWELGNKDCIVVDILTEDTWQKHYTTYTKWEQ